MSGLKAIRYGAWAAVVALAVAAGVVSYQQITGGKGGQALIEPVSAIGGPFTLVAGDGRTVTDAEFKGKPTLYYFGFTFCPDVCPTTLSDMQGWITALGADADKLNYAFVTVDPERDTPEVIRDYVAAFDPRIVPLSGTEAQIADMIRTYRVYAKKVPLDDGGYTMDHSAAVFLMNKDNRFVGTIAYGEAEETALAKLRRLIETAETGS
ncbi:SCO family protein [Polymorphum gilvum]|uniref:Electron transport protein SCO1/SenC n=1 Tax=Polymorphum gilvum (strain LMG 25793 / CGMCC 1.9160 / SL003B-26A1) TaxID=991905 RepID=F2IYB3_POLGS|nr:SCO family protein [Polymorphum gilvum]ADZ71725.1 Electron transport protein SCO1/SenC [Polymorphum gilvum SL003B-26A1]